MKSVFRGDIPEDLLFPYPDSTSAESDVIKVIIDNVQRWAENAFDASETDEAGHFAEGTLESLAEMGLFGLVIPERYGGLELSHTSYARIFESLSRIDGSLPTTVGAHSSIGIEGLLLYGTPEQKARYLPDLATGEKIAAFALTEPGAGSDAGSIQTRAERQEDGSWLLNGQKQWITNGGIAQFFTVFAMTPVTKAGKTEDKISAFIVEGDVAGLRRGPEEKKMGIKASSTVSLYFDNVKLPPYALLGEEGKGFKVAMNVLNSGRLGMAAGVVGGGKAILEVAARHAQQRKQFGKPIGEFELIQEKLSRMAVAIYAAESMVYLTTHFVDRGDIDFSIESAICKVFASESSWNVVNDGLQVMGGLGYMKEYPFERVLRDSRVNMIFEGTNEILRLFIALAGMQAPGEYLKEVGQSLREPIKGFGLLVDYAVTRVKEAVTPRHLSRAHPALIKWSDSLAKSVDRFHRAIDSSLLKFGKRVVDRQLMLQRFADCAIEIYGMAAVLSRVTAKLESVGEQQAQPELDITRIYCSAAQYKIRRNIRMLRRNEDRPLRRLAKEVYRQNGYPVR